MSVVIVGGFVWKLVLKFEIGKSITKGRDRNRKSIIGRKRWATKEVVTRKGRENLIKRKEEREGQEGETIKERVSEWSFWNIIRAYILSSQRSKT